MNITFRGCRISIDFSFVLMLSFACLSGAKDLVYLILFSSLHEAGHLSALLFMKCKPSLLKLSFYGFAIKYESKIGSLAEAIVLLSGPAVNLLLYLILRDNVNLLLFILNIIPIYPLDGGRILSLFFPKAARYIGIALLAFVYVTAIYLLIFYKAFSLLLIALYLTVYYSYPK